MSTDKATYVEELQNCFTKTIEIEDDFGGDVGSFTHVYGIEYALGENCNERPPIHFYNRASAVDLRGAIEGQLEKEGESQMYVNGVPGTGKSISTWATVLQWTKSKKKTMLWVHYIRGRGARVIFVQGLSNNMVHLTMS